eukprot:g2324.t1
MGKVNRRRQKRRHDPKGADAGDPRDSEEIRKGLTGLGSADPKIRENASAAIAHLLSGLDNDSKVGEKGRRDIYRARLKRLESFGIVKRMIPLLCDTSAMIRVHTLGAIRNMCFVGEKRMCDTLVKADIISVVEASLRKLCSERDTAYSRTSMERKQLEQILSVLTLLCDHSELAVERIGEIVFRSVYICLTRYFEAKDVSVAETAAQLLHVLSDGNVPMTSWIASSTETVHTLTVIVATDTSKDFSNEIDRAAGLRVRLHLSGLLFNCAVQRCVATRGGDDPASATLFRKSVDAASQVLQIALQRLDAAKALTELVRVESSAASNESEGVHVESHASAWSEIASVQMTALEVVANVFSDADVESESDDASLSAAQMLLSASSQRSMVESVVRLIRSVGGGPSWDRLREPRVYASAHGLRFRALSCLSNMIQIAPSNIMFASASEIRTLWSFLFDLCARCSQESPSFESSVPVRERGDVIASGLLWSMARRSDIKSGVRLDAAQEKALRVMLKAEVSDIRLHACGVFAAMCENERMDKDAARRLAVVLCHASRDADLLVVSEALNGLFDLFGESNRDDIFTEMRVMGILTGLSSSIRAKLRATKRPEADTERIEEAFENLVRFIEYKQASMRGGASQ